jgi:viroplasmin and RNaseH domain-containing protein
MNTSQEDRQEITWIFLNASDSEAYLELDESFSENKENIERDKEALIIWSILDGDLLEEERSKLLLGWCG